ncbi:MAG: Heterodisulfide reductase subunit [Actinomycetota bacterium]|nr:Heterodisulfide reductase subunit [Actinomycetota bacterium]
MKIGYYPGCALHGSSNDYEQSVRACLGVLGVDLAELDDWVCCGATAAHSVSRTLAVALPARNLAIAERDGLDQLLAPCPLCSMEFCASKRLLQNDPEAREKMSRIVEAPVTGATDVLNLVQVLQQVGADTLRERAVRELGEFRPACYYGCMLTRPRAVVAFDDPEHPTSMQEILAALGAEPVDWNAATECCGAGLTIADPETVAHLAGRVLADARSHGANCLVVACPMCHVNLDMKQQDAARAAGVPGDLPVYYLSDLVGLALGLSPSVLGVDRHLVPARTTADAGPGATAGKRGE